MQQVTWRKKVRSAGIIDESGKLLAGGFREGVRPLAGDETRLQHITHFIAQISIRKRFDKSLGSINYIATRRNKIVLISFPFPISKEILLISAEPTVDIERLAKRVTEIFNDQEIRLFVED
jgi:hypothetical protein